MKSDLLNIVKKVKQAPFSKVEKEKDNFYDLRLSMYVKIDKGPLSYSGRIDLDVGINLADKTFIYSIEDASCEKVFLDGVLISSVDFNTNLKNFGIKYEEHIPVEADFWGADYSNIVEQHSIIQALGLKKFVSEDETEEKSEEKESIFISRSRE